MRTSTIAKSLALVLLATSIGFSEPIGTFGVNGPGSWNQPPMNRVKHTDSFGDIYYTFVPIESSKCVKKEIHKASKSMQQIPQEITSAMNNIFMALDALKKHDIQNAKDQLSKAEKQFETIVKKNPNLKKVPINHEIDVYELQSGVKEIRSDIHMAQNLLINYKTQAARELLMPLKDEIDIVTQYIPLNSFPKTIKKTITLLDQNKEKAALSTLVAGMNTIVTKIVVIPISLLRAQEDIQKASKMAEKNAKEAVRFLQKAKEEIYKAYLLGYTDKHSKEYRNLYKQLSKLQNELHLGHKTEKLFKQTKKNTHILLNKLYQEEIQKEHKAAQMEELNDKLRFLREMETDIF